MISEQMSHEHYSKYYLVKDLGGIAVNKLLDFL